MDKELESPTCPGCLMPSWDCQCEYVDYIIEDEEDGDNTDPSEL